MTQGQEVLPILYSFRRCPYAMRARLALKMAGVKVHIREILLKQKPESMLAISPKGTVPVLLLPSGQVLDESRDIMVWAQQYSTSHSAEHYVTQVEAWLDINDYEFKPQLDRYKYADRYPEHSPQYYRRAGERFLMQLELQLRAQNKLDITQFVLGSKVTAADIGIFPFVRQFSMVDQAWFEQSDYSSVRQWLNSWLGSNSFDQIMTRYRPWQLDDDLIEF